AGGGLASHRGDCFRRRTDPYQLSVAHCAREPLALGEESVTRVNRLSAGLFCRLDDFFAPEIALARRRWPNQYRFVGFADVRRPRVSFAVDGDRSNSELVARSNHTQRDLAAVR